MEYYVDKKGPEILSSKFLLYPFPSAQSPSLPFMQVNSSSARSLKGIFLLCPVLAGQFIHQTS